MGKIWGPEIRMGTWKQHVRDWFEGGYFKKRETTINYTHKNTSKKSKIYEISRRSNTENSHR